jgi:2-iminobutanoate/2-iminopropanoate deaminase
MCEAYHYDQPVGFSRGMEVRLAGARLVFVSGTASVGPDGSTLHPGDLGAQARRMYDNASAVLRSAGADWRDVVKATVFLKDIASDYAAFNAVRLDYFRRLGLDVYPASTCVEARLCRDDLLVEMELLAIVADEGARPRPDDGAAGKERNQP